MNRLKLYLLALTALAVCTAINAAATLYRYDEKTGTETRGTGFV